MQVTLCLIMNVFSVSLLFGDRGGPPIIPKLSDLHVHNVLGGSRFLHVALLKERFWIYLTLAWNYFWIILFIFKRYKFGWRFTDILSPFPAEIFPGLNTIPSSCKICRICFYMSVNWISWICKIVRFSCEDGSADIFYVCDIMAIVLFSCSNKKKKLFKGAPCTLTPCSGVKLQLHPHADSYFTQTVSMSVYPTNQIRSEMFKWMFGHHVHKDCFPLCTVCAYVRNLN